MVKQKAKRPTKAKTNAASRSRSRKAKPKFGEIKLHLPGGHASACDLEPVKRILDDSGITDEFCRQFNAETADKEDQILPVTISNYGRGKFDFTIGKPVAETPAAINQHRRENCALAMASKLDLDEQAKRFQAHVWEIWAREDVVPIPTLALLITKWADANDLINFELLFSATTPTTMYLARPTVAWRDAVREIETAVNRGDLEYVLDDHEAFRLSKDGFHLIDKRRFVQWARANEHPFPDGASEQMEPAAPKEVISRKDPGTLKAEWDFNEDGSFVMRVGKRKVEFRKHNGKKTEQMILMAILASDHPKYRDVGKLMEEVLGRECTPENVERDVGRLSSVVRAARKKIRKAGLPEDILPKMSASLKKPATTLRLNLESCDGPYEHSPKGEISMDTAGPDGKSLHDTLEAGNLNSEVFD